MLIATFNFTLSVRSGNNECFSLLYLRIYIYIYIYNIYIYIYIYIRVEEVPVLWLVVGWLLGFYGISTFVGYLMPNTFLYQ